MIVAERYRNELELVRRNPDLLKHYSFDKDSPDSKHFDRLRLNIAMYNDLRPTDFEIAKFLFAQEKEWRKYGKDGDVDNLYFSAFVLALFKSPEIVWQFFETKGIDFDSGIGFDEEFLLAAGIEKTYHFLKTANHPLKEAVLKLLGETRERCRYLQNDIDAWIAHKELYFKNYKYPIQDELFFLYATNERSLFLTRFPEWINQMRTWTPEQLSLYRTYAAYSGDKNLEIAALKLAIEHEKVQLSSLLNQLALASLYIDSAMSEAAFEMLKKTIVQTTNNNLIRDCIEQLCRIVINATQMSDRIVKEAYGIILTQRKKYKRFSPKVDGLIEEVRNKMVLAGISDRSCISGSAHRWWQKVFKL